MCRKKALMMKKEFMKNEESAPRGAFLDAGPYIIKKAIQNSIITRPIGSDIESGP